MRTLARPWTLTVIHPKPFEKSALRSYLCIQLDQSRKKHTSPEGDEPVGCEQELM